MATGIKNSGIKLFGMSRAALLALTLSVSITAAHADAPDGEINPDEITMDVVPTGSPDGITRDREENKAAITSRPAGDDRPDDPKDDESKDDDSKSKDDDALFKKPAFKADMNNYLFHVFILCRQSEGLQPNTALSRKACGAPCLTLEIKSPFVPQQGPQRGTLKVMLLVKIRIDFGEGSLWNALGPHV